jgi:hypothetical protein
MQAMNIETVEDYLVYYEKVIDWQKIKIEFPRTHALYENLCNHFRLEYEQASRNFFHSLRQLLAIDAQLQILVQLFKSEQEWTFFIDDEEIVDMISRDKNSFYRETIGLKKNAWIPWGLMFLSEQN